MDSAQHDSYNAAVCQMPQLLVGFLQTKAIDRADMVSCLCGMSDGETLALTAVQAVSCMRRALPAALARPCEL